MSNFWIQISESGMPQAVQKVEFMPTIGWNWENFGKRGELKAKDAEIKKLNEECEVWRIKLAACGVAALSNTHKSIKDRRIDSNNPYYSASYSDVCDAVDREIALREDNEKKDAEIARLRKALEMIKENSLECFNCSASLLAEEALEEGK